MVCTSCLIPFGVMNGTCQLCNDTNCYDCRNDFAVCFECYIGYGVNIPIRTCVGCNDTNCANCTHDSAVCFACNSGYGLNGTAQCELCNTTVQYCQNCSATDLGICLFCWTPKVLVSNLCLDCMVGCDICTNLTGCVNCSVGYYKQPNTVCAICSNGCFECFINQIYNLI